jgi:hypothetical protein
VAVSGVGEVTRRWGGSASGRRGRAKRAHAQDAAAARLEKEEDEACGWGPCVSERKREGVETTV